MTPKAEQIIQRATSRKRKPVPANSSVDESSRRELIMSTCDKVVSVNKRAIEILADQD